MTNDDDLVTRVRGAVGPGIAVKLDGGDILLAGEVQHLSQKKLLLERAAAVPGTAALIDRLRIVPALARTDPEILEEACSALAAEPLLGDCAIHPDCQCESLRASALFPEGSSGLIAVSVENGVVTLDGEVTDLSQKQLAGVVVWQTAGCRDVVNGIEVAPSGGAGEEVPLEAVVKMALEREPALDLRSIVVSAQGTTVTLEGRAASAAAAEIAENDAWAVFGVDRVCNKLVVEAR